MKQAIARTVTIAAMMLLLAIQPAQDVTSSAVEPRLSPSASECAAQQDVLPAISPDQDPIVFVGKVIDIADATPTESSPRTRPHSIATVAVMRRAVGDMSDTLRVLQRTVVWWSRGRLKIVVHEGEYILYPGDQIAVVATLSPAGGRLPWNAAGPVWIPEYLGIILGPVDDAGQPLYRAEVDPGGQTPPGPEDVGKPVRQFIRRNFEPAGLELSEFLRECETRWAR